MVDRQRGIQAWDQRNVSYYTYLGVVKAELTLGVVKPDEVI